MPCNNPYTIKITWNGSQFSGGARGDVPSTSDCLRFHLVNTSHPPDGDHITGVQFYASPGAYRRGIPFSPGYLDPPGGTTDGGVNWDIEFNSTATPKVTIFYKLLTKTSAEIEHDYDPSITIEPRT